MFILQLDIQNRDTVSNQYIYIDATRDCINKNIMYTFEY